MTPNHVVIQLDCNSRSEASAILKVPTVLVLGAGSSCGFGLPAGDALMTTISDRVNFRLSPWDNDLLGDMAVWNAFGIDFGKEEACLRAGQVIARGLPHSTSIDDFLYLHGKDLDVVAVGKLAIVSSILEAERTASGLSLLSSSNADERAVGVHGLRTCWISKLVARLLAGRERDSLDDLFDNLTVISFNYDRVFEQVLLEVLQVHLHVDDVRAATLIESLKIHHPYGQVGKLPWQRGVEEKVALGAAPNPRLFADLSRQIRTLRDQRAEKEEVDSWKDAITAAHTVLFMGFGFHKQNVELLTQEKKRHWMPQVYLTTYGALPEHAADFRQRAEKIVTAPSKVTALDVTCDEAMDRLGLRLFS